MAGEIKVGVMGSSAGAQGLALLRLDRAEEAAQAGQALVSGETRLRLIVITPRSGFALSAANWLKACTAWLAYITEGPAPI